MMAIQRFIKRTVEAEVFSPLLRASGHDPLEAKVRISWGQPEIPELQVPDMLTALEKGAISREELRAMLTKSGWELGQGEAT